MHNDKADVKVTYERDGKRKTVTGYAERKQNQEVMLLEFLRRKVQKKVFGVQ